MPTEDPNAPPTIGRAARDAARAPTGVDVPPVPALADAVSAARASTSGPMQDRLGADGLGPEREFTLDYLDGRGRKWGGDFKVRVLTIKDTVQLGLVKARLAGGIPLTHLDGDTAYTLEVLAHLSVAIVASPPWAKDLLALHDAGVIGAIYEEVAKYEARFRGAKRIEAGGVDGSGS
jgi:hypothetical protein